MILKGFLGERFASEKPLSLSASMAFEQSYSMVDGDSASSTELYALLSSLSGIPVRQHLAVTGSINQKGEIQPIGGVNEKIEGFFRVCSELGLSGDQGVMIPEKNVDNLMLAEDVVEAVAEGRFHIYAVRTVEEGIETLTGVAAGAPDEDGSYPAESVFGRVADRLEAIREALKEEKDEKGDGDEKESSEEGTGSSAQEEEG
jgi:predicted ATP-dependent protease